MSCLAVLLSAVLASSAGFWFEDDDDSDFRRWEDPATNITALGETRTLDAWVRRPFSITGTIVAHTYPGLVLRDDSGCAELSCNLPDIPPPGAIVHARGMIHHFEIGNQTVEIKTLDTVRLATPPKPMPITINELLQGKGAFLPVKIEGVVTEATHDEIDSQWNWIVIRQDGLTAAICLGQENVSQAALDDFIDARISVTGIAIPSGFGYRKNLGVRVEIASLADIEVLKAPPDSFTGNGSMSLMPTEGNPRIAYEHRQKVSGTVVAAWGGKNLFIETPEKERIRVSLGKQTETPPPGSRISVAGFVRRNAFFTWLSNAVFRPEGDRVSAPSESAIEISRLFTTRPNGSRIFVPAANGRRTRLKGRVVSTFAAGTRFAHLGLSTGGEIIQVEIGALTPPPVNAEVEITGVCVMSTESAGDDNGFGHITGYFIVTQFQSDIRILKSPPWWTPVRSLSVIGALLLVIGAILLWNVSLKRLSDRKSRNLLKERQARLEAQLRIDERTRLAVELHDSLAQNLTGISLQLDAAEMAEGEDRTAALSHLGNAREALRSCREGLRYCLSDLRSRSFEDSDMTEAVTETVRPHIGKTRLFVRFNVPRARLSDTTAHAILCVVRELAVNAVRHGHATDIRIAGEFRDGQIRFSVRDNGRGFDPDSRPGSAQGHFGLLGVSERIGNFKGSLKIDSAIGKGTKATVTLNIS